MESTETTAAAAAATPPPAVLPPPPAVAAVAAAAAAAVPKPNIAPRCKNVVVADLPNLLLSTTYAINKSNTKRITVGLEYFGGFYRAVVKLCSTGSPAKYVTLDKYSWELIVDQLDALNAYLQDSYSFYNEFGKPSKLFLPNHDISFTTAYGVKAIVIDERPQVQTSKHERRGEHGTQQQVLEDDEDAQLPNLSQFEPPACKKKKYDNPPGIVMQQATLNGLRTVRECVDACLRRLEESAGFINRSLDNIMEYLKNELNKEGSERAKHILKDSAAFKQYYILHREEIDGIARLNEFMSLSDDSFNTALSEICAFGLTNMAKDLYDFMFTM